MDFINQSSVEGRCRSTNNNDISETMRCPTALQCQSVGYRSRSTYPMGEIVIGGDGQRGDAAS